MAVLVLLPTQAFGELFSNPSFEDTNAGQALGWGEWGCYVSGWCGGGYYTGEGYTELEENNPAYPAFDGQNCARAYGNGYGTHFQSLILDSDYIPGNTYYWGFWAKHVTPGSIDNLVRTHVRFFLTTDTNGSGDENLEVDHAIPADGNWHYVETPFTIPAGMQAMAVYCNKPGDGDILFDLAHLGSAPFEIDFATAPIPNDGKIVGTSLTDLSWTNPADMVSVDVYLLDAGTSPRANDPNLGPAIFDPGVVQLVDDGAVATASLPSTPVFGHYYYWAVHVTDSSTETQGMVWSYSVGDAAPVVDAGANQYEGLDPTVATISLDGSVTDDGISPMVTLWTVDPAGPVIASDTSQVTTATVSAIGAYTFTLTATDTTGAVADTMTATVYDTPCEAAFADPADAPFPGDITGPSDVPDCEVTILDFAAMAADWLGCMSTKLGCTP
ncbi:MAG: carbohydrate binding domain-containing protein [Planctomycetota bacterium]